MRRILFDQGMPFTQPRSCARSVIRSSINTFRSILWTITQFTGIGFGACHSKRHSEEIEGRLPMRELISQSIIDSVARDPDVLLDLSKRDFEKLMAELFARMGFEV